MTPLILRPPRRAEVARLRFHHVPGRLLRGQGPRRARPHPGRQAH